MGATAAVVGLTAMTIGNTITQRDAILAKGRVDESVARSEARISRIQKADAIRRGNKQVSRLRGQKTLLTGAQVANIAAQGIDPRSGSGAAVIIESRMFGDLDIIEAKRNARLEAFGFEARALSSEGRARFARLNSKAAARQTLLTGSSQIAKDLLLFGASSKSKFKPRNPTEKRFNNDFRDSREAGFAR